MPQISNIVIADGQPTPVAHTFNPDGINSEMVASFADRSAGVPAGYNVITASLRKPSKASKNYKAQLKVVLPTTETPAGITYPVKAYECSAFVDIVLPERSSLQNRKDLLALLKNLLANAIITSMVQDLEQVW